MLPVASHAARGYPAAGGPVPAPLTQTLVPPAVAARHPHQKRHRLAKEESPSPGRHSLRSRRNGGKPTGCLSGVGVKRHPPTFSRFGASGSRQHNGRLAGGSLRCLLTFQRWRIDRPLDGGLARRPTLRTKPPGRSGIRPAPALHSRAAQRGRDRFVALDVNRVRRDPAGSPVEEWVADIDAGPGEAGWNPVDAHIRRPSCRSPFDPIEGDAPRRGAFFGVLPDSPGDNPDGARCRHSRSRRPRHGGLGGRRRRILDQRRPRHRSGNRPHPSHSSSTTP